MEHTPSQDTIHASYVTSNVQMILKEVFPPVRKHPTKKLLGIGKLLTGDEVRHISVSEKLRGVHITPFMDTIPAPAERARKTKNTVHMRIPIFVSRPGRPQTAQVRKVRMPSEINMPNMPMTVKHS